MTSYDHFAEAGVVAVALSEQGWQEDSRPILRAMVNGSTGSQICMALRLKLAALATRSALSSEMTRPVHGAKT